MTHRHAVLRARIALALASTLAISFAPGCELTTHFGDFQSGSDTGLGTDGGARDAVTGDGHGDETTRNSRASGRAANSASALGAGRAGECQLVTPAWARPDKPSRRAQPRADHFAASCFW